MYGVSAHKHYGSCRKESISDVLFTEMYHAVGTGGKEMCENKIRPEELMGGVCDECKGVISEWHIIVQRYNKFTRNFCSPDCFVKAGIIEENLDEMPRGQ